MKKSKVHEVVVKIRFDKPISIAGAVAAFKDNIHGEFYLTAWCDNDPETMVIKSVVRRSRGR